MEILPYILECNGYNRVSKCTINDLGEYVKARPTKFKLLNILQKLQLNPQVEQIKELIGEIRDLLSELNPNLKLNDNCLNNIKFLFGIRMRRGGGGYNSINKTGVGNTKRKYRKGKSKSKRKRKYRKRKSKSKSKRKRKYKELRSFKKKGGAAEEVDIKGLIDAIKKNIIIVSHQKSVLGKSTVLEKDISFSDETITFDDDINDSDRRKLFRIDYTDSAEKQGNPKSLFFKVAPLGPTEIETGTEGKIKWVFAGSEEEYETKDEAIAEINKQLKAELTNNGDGQSVHYEHNPDKCGYYFSEDFYHESIIYYHLNNKLKENPDLNDNVLNIYGFGVIESENPIFKVKWGLKYDSDEAELFTELVMRQIDRIKTICKSLGSKYITYQIVECDSDYKTIVELQEIYKLDKETIGTILDQCAGIMEQLYHECKFVHYDLHGDNWLISKTIDGQFKIKLFDFDLSIIYVKGKLYKSWLYDEYMVKLQGCGLDLRVFPDLYFKMIHIFDLYRLYFNTHLDEELLDYQSYFMIQYFKELDGGTYGLSQSIIEEIRGNPGMYDWYTTTKDKIDNSTTKPKNLDDLFNLELYLEKYKAFFRLKQFSNIFMPNEIISYINKTFLSIEAPSNITNFLKVDDLVKQFLFMIWLVVNTIN